MSAAILNCQSSVMRAHQRSEITSMIANPYCPNEIITIAHDGFIRGWSHPDFSMTRQVRFRTPYLTCIVPFGEGFLLATGNGSLLRLNKDFQLESSMLLHDDCLSHITVGQNGVYTVGYDGLVCFLNKNTLALENTLHVESPILQSLVHENNLYLAGNPSYKINLLNKSVTTLKRFSSFLLHAGEVLGCSDQKGVTCLSNNRNNYVPCQFMISIGRDIIFMSEGSLGMMNFTNSDEVSWEIMKTPQLKKSYSILTGIHFKNSIILAGECSNIYSYSKNSLIKYFPQDL